MPFTNRRRRETQRTAARNRRVIQKTDDLTLCLQVNQAETLLYA